MSEIEGLKGTTPDDGDSFHSHDGVIEVNIPPWLIWSASLVGVGLLGWLIYDVWTQRRKPVSEQELRTTLRQRQTEDLEPQIQAVYVNPGHPENGRVMSIDEALKEPLLRHPSNPRVENKTDESTAL